ncbi:MAG: hypothetical protein ABI564_01445 [Ideonella sp.]
MWFSGWVWFKGVRADRPRLIDDRADMGVEIGLDASLDSMLPPLMNFAVHQHNAITTTPAMPLGTDLRSRYNSGN